MTTYTATFSNGETIVRTSKRQYRYAVGLVNKTTGKLANVTFTNSATPKPNWWGIASLPYGVMSNRDRNMYTREIMAERENWNIEIIALSQSHTTS